MLATWASRVLEEQEENAAKCMGKVTPRMRWNFIQAANSSTTQELIAKKSKSHNRESFEYAIQLERQIYDASHNGTFSSYGDMVTQIIPAMLSNGPSIRRRLRPADVISASTKVLMEGTVVDRARQQMESHETNFRAMLQERFDDDNSEGLLKCRNCKSANVVWEQRQTRSADEGMSIYAMCMACKTKWQET